MAPTRIGIDIGGTFTDISVLDEATGKVSTAKVLSTRDDPSECIASAFEEVITLGYNISDVEFVAHGTTVATNALLESKGARASMIITKGYRAVPEVGDQTRDQKAIYDLNYQRPPLLIPQRRILEVDERIDSNGRVVHPLEKKELQSLVDELKRDGAESVAICLLFSFVNPSHEEEIAKEIRARLKGVNYISVSSSVIPQIREHPRLSTVMVDAYVGPILKRYIEGLEAGLRQMRVRPFPYIVHSGGGMMTAEAAKSKAVWCIESGPAAGVVMASKVGALISSNNLFAFDMGGTTAKFGMVYDGEPLVTTQFKHAGYRIAIPVLDLIEIGSGGGSIAWIDHSGFPRVGPESSGAEPGPACYGRGGKLPTVTDADLVLGYLNPSYFLGGKMPLYAERAEAAIAEHVGFPLKMGTLEAAHGIFTIVNVQMSEALKMASVERGHDPRDFSMIAFGGAGPAHACWVAREVGVPRVVVPLFPGVATAKGLTTMDVKQEYSLTRLSAVDETSTSQIEREFNLLESKALDELQSEGFTNDKVLLKRYLDMHYQGQGYEIRVSVMKGEDAKTLRARFDTAHERSFGMKAEREKVEIVNFRVVSQVILKKVDEPYWNVNGSEKARKPSRKAYFGDPPKLTECAVLDRMRLPRGFEIKGPAILEQPDSTTVVPPEDTATIDRYGNVIIDLSR